MVNSIVHLLQLPTKFRHEVHCCNYCEEFYLFPIFINKFIILKITFSIINSYIYDTSFQKILITYKITVRLIRSLSKQYNPNKRKESG